MFENILNFFKKIGKNDNKETNGSKNKAKERLHLVLMQDRANVSADFLELMKQEIIEVIKKYIEVDEGAIDVRLTNKANDDGTTGAPALYANIPIMNIKHEMGKEQSEKENKEEQEEVKPENEKEEKNELEEKAENKENEENKTNDEEKNETEKIEENKDEEEKSIEESDTTNNEEEPKEEIPVTNK